MIAKLRFLLHNAFYGEEKAIAAHPRRRAAPGRNQSRAERRHVHPAATESDR